MFGARLNKLGAALKSRPPQAAFNFSLAGQDFDERITYTGASARMRFDSTGTLQYAPMNLIRNSTMVGAVVGSPGTLPTNWTTTLAGLTQTVVGVGTEAGISYIDLRFNGTTTGTQIIVALENFSNVTAATGQTWTIGAFLAIVGGSTVNITSTPFILQERTAAGVLVSSAASGFVGLTSGLTRSSITATLAGGATVERIGPIFRLNTTVGVAIDITLRIGLPQLQLGSVATDPIPTTTAAVYLPRSNAYQDHNPSTLAPLGFLIEEQRTNSIRNNTMQGATGGVLPTNWTGQINLGHTQTIAAAGTTSGINTIDIGISGTASSTGATALAFDSLAAIAASPGQVWTGSFYLALAAGSLSGLTALELSIREFDSGGGFLRQTVVNVIAISATLQRFTGTATMGASTASVQLAIRPSYTASTAAAFTLRIGLPQLELGAFATSPILTTGAAATRLADVASITGTNFSSFWNQTEGTVVANFIPNADASAARVAIDANDGTASTRLSLTRSLTLKGQMFASIANVAQANFQTANNVGAIAKLAGAYKLDDFALSANGGAVVTDTSATVPTVSQLNFGARADTGNTINGHLQSLAYYAKRLPNATLQSLTV